MASVDTLPLSSYPMHMAADQMTPHMVDANTAPPPRRGRDAQDERDNQLISDLLSGVGPDDSAFDFLDRDLEPGEKAKDAEDFEDIGDDDLADEDDGLGDAEAGSTGVNGVDSPGGDAPAGLDTRGDGDAGLDEEMDHDAAFDDLFGDQPSSPQGPTPDDGMEEDVFGELSRVEDDREGSVQARGSTTGSFGAVSRQNTGQVTLREAKTEPDLHADAEDDTLDHDSTAELINTAQDDDPELREQRELFAQAQREREERLRKGTSFGELPPPPTTNAELFETIWPRFEPHQPPRFHALLGVKRAFYVGKRPTRVPKPIQPSKVSLDLLPDQERSFRLAGSAVMTRPEQQAKAEQERLVFVHEVASPMEREASGDDDDDGRSDDEPVAGVTLADLQVLCEDWDVEHEAVVSPLDVDMHADDDWEQDRPSKVSPDVQLRCRVYSSSCLCCHMWSRVVMIHF